MNKKWHIFARGPVPLYRIDFFEVYRDYAAKHNRKFFCNLFFACEEKAAYFGWGIRGADEWNDILLKKLSREKSRKDHYQKYESYCNRAISASEKVRKMDLKKLDNIKLVEALDYLENEARLAQSLTNPDLDVFDIYFNDFLQGKIIKELNAKRMKVAEQELLDIFRELTDPVYTTFVASEERLIAQIALKGGAGKKDIEKLHDKFWWVCLGWENLTPRTEKYYAVEIKKYAKKKNLEKIIAEIDGRPKKIKEKRKKILARYSLGKNISELLEIFDKFTYFHDLRKEMQMRTVFAFDLISIEIAKRAGIRDDERELFSHREMKEILVGKKIGRKEIEERKKATAVLVTRRGIKMLTGNRAIAFREKELKQNTGDISEFKGTGVTKGKVRARVKVCNGVDDAFKKVKKGDILVTGMTLPDYVPVMKIASAVITNEGGITCHAAIVCRELGLPCIVGTKIATQVLKDGDLVEVDADKGVVRILK